MQNRCQKTVFIFFAILSSLSTAIQADEISFELDVQPVLTSAGCNSGGCHGKQRGQNGFQLSLLGFDSDFDFAAITKESRGRRVFPAAPEQSLILLKAIGQVPHGGGKRFEKNSSSYNTLLAWLNHGAKRHAPNETRLKNLSLNLTDVLLKPGEKRQLELKAIYEDGSTRNVTAFSTFQSNDPAIVKVSSGGELQAGSLPGETAVMARYMNVIEVCSVAIPREQKVDPRVFETIPRNNFVDDLVYKKLKRLNLTPSKPIDDAKFLRRVYTDIVGRLPTAEEARSFLESQVPGKRSKLVDRLLDMPEYAEFMANKWADLLRTNPYRVGIKTTLNYDHWIRQQFRRNVPYDQFVRSLLTAKGSTFRNGAVTMFRDRRSPDELTTIVTQLFLGIRLECAKCHHHPFEKWSQEDFYSFAAFFGEVGRKGTGLSPPISGSEEIILDSGKRNVVNPANGQVMSARPLFGELPTATTTESQNPTSQFKDSSAPKSKRELLADWVTSDENSYFAMVQVNRVWADLMGRGLVEPVDDIRATNPPTNSELLNALAKDFQQSGYDLKHLIRTICNSHVYGLSSVPNEINSSDRLNYSRHYRHRLRAETLIDSIDQIAGSSSKFEAVPAGSRASEIWTHRTQSLFLDTFGRPNPNEDPPCERTREFTVTQSLHLMNAEQIHRKLTASGGTTAKLAGRNLSPQKLAEEIYLMIYNRFPSNKELEFAIKVLSGENESRESADNKVSSKDKESTQKLKRRIEDLMWAMINTPEFSIQD